MESSWVVVRFGGGERKRGVWRDEVGVRVGGGLVWGVGGCVVWEMIFILCWCKKG